MEDGLFFTYKFDLTPNHSQQHFKPDNGMQGVFHTGRHDDRFPLFQADSFASEHDLRLTVEYLHQRVERCGVFAQSLIAVKGDLPRFSAPVC